MKTANETPCLLSGKVQVTDVNGDDCQQEDNRKEEQSELILAVKKEHIKVKGNESENKDEKPASDACDNFIVLKNEILFDIQCLQASTQRGKGQNRPIKHGRFAKISTDFQAKGGGVANRKGNEFDVFSHLTFSANQVYL